MERDIKFRGKIACDDLKELEDAYVEIPHKNGWVVGSFIAPNLIVGDVAEIDWDFFATEWWVKVIPETVGQFTGLLDNNGIKIYEGDILYERYEDEMEDDGYGEVYYEVVFKDGAFGVMTEIADLFLPFSYNPRTTEVVAGNIHDYPEILELWK